MFLSLLLCLTATLALQRQVNTDVVPTFSSGTLIANIDEPQLTDASGLAASQKFDNVLYTHNDEDPGTPYVFAINAETGMVVSKIEIASATNHDWEDIAVGPCGDSSCIFIADSGRGKKDHITANIIYRVKEPADLSPTQTISIDSMAQYTWPQNQSGTLMVDPSGQVYLIGQIYSGQGMVSTLPASAWGSHNPANITSNQFLPLNLHDEGPTGGDISSDGTEILIRSRTHVFYWAVEGGDVMATLTKPPVELPYHKSSDGWGEAICWSVDGSNYYTLTEGHNPPLYVYTREETLIAPDFSARKLVGNVHEHDLSRASGLAASRKFKDVLYTHNDGHHSHYVFAINATTGELVSKIKIANATNHDWEDMAVGACGDSSCIYIADSGILHSDHTAANIIYKVKEPEVLSPTQTITIDALAHYSWPGEESETLMVDPNGDLYLVGKHRMISRLPASAWGSLTPVNINTTHRISFNGHPKSGDISRDGTQILIKTIDNIFYWSVNDGDVMTALTKPPIKLSYEPTPHVSDEAICWSTDGQSFYTLSQGHDPPLYVYTKTEETPFIMGNLIGK